MVNWQRGGQFEWHQAIKALCFYRILYIAIKCFGQVRRSVVGHRQRCAAMMVWLDAKANRNDKPNENPARELMELLTLGVGPYSQA